MDKMTLNIVIPVLNEENALRSGVEKTLEFLNTTEIKDSFQITINISPVPRLLPHIGGDKAFIGIGKKIHLFLLF